MSELHIANAWMTICWWLYYFSKEADEDIEKLAELTDGKSYYINDEATSAAVHDAFLGALTYQPNIVNSDIQFKLFDKRVDPKGRKFFDFEFEVDLTVGRNLKLSVYNLIDRNALLGLKLIGPNGQEEDKIKFDSVTASITIDSANVWSYIHRFITATKINAISFAKGWQVEYLRRVWRISNGPSRHYSDDPTTVGCRSLNLHNLQHISRYVPT